MNPNSFKNENSDGDNDKPSSPKSTPKTFADMHKEMEARRKSKLPVMSLMRKQKIQFFTQQTVSDQSLGYGNPGSDAWIHGVVKFLNCPTITSGIVKLWITKDPSLIAATPGSVSGTATRTKTLTPIKPSSKLEDIEKTILKRKADTYEPTYSSAWYKFFKNNTAQAQGHPEGHSGGNISAASTSTATSQNESSDATAENCGVIIPVPVEEVPEEIPEEASDDLIPELQLDEGTVYFDLLRACIETNNHELAMKIILDIENLYKLVVEGLARITDANTYHCPRPYGN